MPRWLVLLFDLFVVWVTLLLAYILRFNFDLGTDADFLDYHKMIVVVIVFTWGFYLLRSYSGILRQSTTEDIIHILFALGTGTAILFVISFLLRQVAPGSPLLIPYSIIIMPFTIASNLLLLSRNGKSGLRRLVHKTG